MNYDKFLPFFRRYVEPFLALGVLIILITLSVQLSNGNELREEISQNCGWGEEDYRCFCEKSEAMQIMDKIDGIEPTLGDLEYVSMDR